MNFNSNNNAANLIRRLKARAMSPSGSRSLLTSIVVALLIAAESSNALSLISEKCDPNKVGPDETTVKGGWQAEMFNGLSFRACGKLRSTTSETTRVSPHSRAPD